MAQIIVLEDSRAVSTISVPPALMALSSSGIPLALQYYLASIPIIETY